jgi:CRP-like cAMP-binding protein
MSQSRQAAARNQLLAALPAESLERLLSRLRPVSLPLRMSLLTPDEPISRIWFIERGWASMVTHLDDGAQAEVGLIGWEGMVGVPLASGVNTSFADVYVQAKGSGLEMSADAFQRELEDNPPLRQLLLRYNEALHAQSMQTAACNGRHELEQRLARWLLMAHDRTEGDELPLTQEFLAIMLCVHRPSVTVIAGIFQRAGIIRYSSGRITVLDRHALEASACNCYGAVQKRVKNLLSLP